MAIGLTAICISQWALKLKYYYTIGYALIIDMVEKNIKKTIPKFVYATAFKLASKCKCILTTMSIHLESQILVYVNYDNAF